MPELLAPRPQPMPLLLDGASGSRMVRAAWRTATWLVAVSALSLLWVDTSFAQFQKLSDAEREAVKVALAYCDQGSAGVLPFLDESASLSELDTETAAAEIEARLGPPCEARWTLQTTQASVARHTAVFEVEFESGIDDEILFQFIDDGRGPRLFAVRSLVEPVSQDLDSANDLAGKRTAGEATSPLASAPTLLTVLVLALWGVMAAVHGRPSWSVGRRQLVSGLPIAAAMALIFAVSCGDQASSSPDLGSQGETSLFELGQLAGVRMAMASGSQFEPPETSSESARQALLLWRLQLDLVSDVALEQVRSGLEAVADAARVPLAHKLRARIELLADNKAEMVLAYRRLRELVPVTDGRLTEEALALRARGFRPEASQLLLRATEMGSRQAEPYYAISQDAVLNNDPEGAERAFRAAWELRPSSRRELFQDPLLSLVANPRLDTYPLLELDAPQEPVSLATDVGVREVDFPGSLDVSLVGQHLVASRGRGVIEVPGGSEVAPSGTRSSSPGALERQREAQLLDTLEPLRAQSLSERALASTVLRDDLVVAGRALARSFRWADLVRLTEVVDGQVERAPAELVRLRARALHSLGRLEESRALLLKLTLATLELERNDPATLYALAHQMARESRFELAVRLVRKANQLLPLPSSQGLVEMYQMQAKLAASFGRLQSDHFEIWHPPGKAELADRIAQVLEAERDRLAYWIPVREDADRVIVEMLSFKDFSSYTGGLEVVGLFDGRIKIPFAGVYGLHPGLVAILTHELAHAMITDYTSGQAPKWVQEGVAQFVEMVANRTNPLPDYYRTSRILSFPAVEEVLQGMPNSSLVATAYDQALWTFFYIGAERGRDEVRAILDGYRNGLTTPEVLEEALGLTVDEFDEELKEWWLNAAPSVWTGEVHRYESYVNPYVQRPGERPFEIKLNRRWWDAGRS